MPAGTQTANDRHETGRGLDSERQDLTNGPQSAVAFDGPPGERDPKTGAV
ncbi:hypothetical protein ZHAS_00014014 [Anopheles sinensis]|uniref:Uncharacterized protein n=1 Tax=Anopheles sinensis TaxID=74873 RepID=A0A084W748_ANOSI|nr:hypothetical protein ZHAS_00014014 [Anopheles sinensis]